MRPFKNDHAASEPSGREVNRTTDERRTSEALTWRDRGNASGARSRTVHSASRWPQSACWRPSGRCWAGAEVAQVTASGRPLHDASRCRAGAPNRTASRHGTPRTPRLDRSAWPGRPSSVASSFGAAPSALSGCSGGPCESVTGSEPWGSP
ncbi:hypothetical protein ACTIVE_8806 [Actinomadura verrucosospora]|uniref:Uncharacterized protein n=1 Tax=Actinomadura verrucosospora TaxID=46165 RepID=A0A7D3VZ15_ACTVE|nr:hypothetical protein ACTIVE_8806 [Actinomadura verrucosospora]